MNTQKFLIICLSCSNSECKSSTREGDFTRDDSQRRFLAQHSVAMLEECCNHSKQCRNNVAPLCNITVRFYNRISATNSNIRISLLSVMNSTTRKKQLEVSFQWSHHWISPSDLKLEPLYCYALDNGLFIAVWVTCL